MGTIQEQRIESLRKSLESHKAELSGAMFESHTRRLQDAIASIERALSKA